MILFLLISAVSFEVKNPDIDLYPIYSSIKFFDDLWTKNLEDKSQDSKKEINWKLRKEIDQAARALINLHDKLKNRPADTPVTEEEKEAIAAQLRWFDKNFSWIRDEFQNEVKPLPVNHPDKAALASYQTPSYKTQLKSCVPAEGFEQWLQKSLDPAIRKSLEKTEVARWFDEDFLPQLILREEQKKKKTEELMKQAKEMEEKVRSAAEARQKETAARGCFVGESFVLMMNHKLKAIKDMKVGDFVLTACDEKSPRLNEPCSARVDDVFKKTDSKIRVLFLKGKKGSFNLLTTNQHPVFSVTENKFKAANQIQLGEAVASAKGVLNLDKSTEFSADSKLKDFRAAGLNEAEIKAIRSSFRSDGIAQVYTLNVKGDNMFFVGGTQKPTDFVLVHEYPNLTQDILGGTTADIQQRCFF